jgi:hypothetical protein
MNTTTHNTKDTVKKKHSKIPVTHKIYSSTDYRFLHQHLDIDQLDDAFKKSPQTKVWHAKKNIAANMNDESTINIVNNEDEIEVD